jgi:adenylosuccinate synthase
MKAQIVIDLGFGDSGKGHTVDSLCIDAKHPIVVRFSGGQQCGHGVYMSEEKFHTHASFGSGTLRGVPSYFMNTCTMYLNNMLQEWVEFRHKGITPELYLHPLVKVTTPYDVAFNRMTHKCDDHGTVGLGVGATMDRSLNTGYKVFAMDFLTPTILLQKLEAVKKYYSDKVNLLGYSEEEFEEYYVKEEEAFKANMKHASTMFKIKDYQYLVAYETLIFEGSQGVMLDMDHGTFPNVTYAHTTCANAMEVANHLCDEVEMYYVTRCYLTRHGNGWLPEGENLQLINNHMETNQLCEYQGMFKTREISAELLNYALNVDECYISSSPVSKSLVITCLDQLPEFDPIKLYEGLTTNFNAVYTSNSHISSSLSSRKLI